MEHPAPDLPKTRRTTLCKLTCLCLSSCHQVSQVLMTGGGAARGGGLSEAHVTSTWKDHTMSLGVQSFQRVTPHSLCPRCVPTLYRCDLQLRPST